MRTILATIFFAFFSTPLEACELALILAVDVSGSVDPEEYDVQMQGLAAALRDGVVSEALVRANARVLLMQWTGSTRQIVSLPWRKIQNFQDVSTLADDVGQTPGAWRNFSTAIGEALSIALAQFDAVLDCRRKVIDVSGDGPSNEGVSPKGLHPALAAAGVTVNAIAIEASDPDLTAYFWENVIIGEGAFVVTAATYKDYPARIREKLRRETVAQVSCLAPCRAIP